MSSKIKLKKKPPWRRPSAPSELLAEGIRHHRAGELEAAVARYRRVLAAEADQADALHFLGVALHQQGQSQEALTHLGRALALEPEHADAYSNRGNVWKELGRLDEAEADYRRALALRPDDVNALNNLGTVQRQRGELAAAVAAFERVLALKPDLAGTWQNLGNALGALDRFDEALAAHREAMRLAPQSADSYRNLGRMLYALGRIDEAGEIYRQWFDRFPDDPRARHFVASCTGGEIPARAADDYVRAEFDAFAETFDTSLAALDYRGPTLVAEAVARLHEGGERRLAVLDAGCGTGLCAPSLRPLASFLAGVDLSAGMVAQARQRGLYDELVVAELTGYLAAHPARWDLVVSGDTLVYFGDLGPVLDAAADGLRPGGALVFTVEAAAPDTTGGFRLNPHGRYSHTRGYLGEALGRARFVDTAIEATTLRKEAGRWVDGFLVTARRAAGA